MGHRYGIATRIRIKIDAPKEVIAFFDYLYDIEQKENVSHPLVIDGGTEIRPRIESLRDNLTSWALGYMDTWYWRVKEVSQDYILYESRSGNKSDASPDFVSLLFGIQHHLFLEEGDILYRCIYEEAAREDIVCFEDGTFKIDETRGYKYRSDQGYVTDWEHPNNTDLSKEEEQMTQDGTLNRCVRPKEYHELTWSVKELDAQRAKEKLRQERINKVRRGRRDYGFGD